MTRPRSRKRCAADRGSAPLLRTRIRLRRAAGYQASGNVAAPAKLERRDLRPVPGLGGRRGHLVAGQRRNRHHPRGFEGTAHRDFGGAEPERLPNLRLVRLGNSRRGQSTAQAPAPAAGQGLHGPSPVSGPSEPAADMASWSAAPAFGWPTTWAALQGADKSPVTWR
jgi:hypothetical protein